MGAGRERVDLDELEDLHQSTTPGPWELADGGWGVYITAPSVSDHVWAREEVPNPANVAFAVETHRRLPALVAELRELRERYGKDGEVWCGARRDQAGTAYCVEMAGHEQHGCGHMWHADPSTHQAERGPLPDGGWCPIETQAKTPHDHIQCIERWSCDPSAHQAEGG